MEVPPRNKKRVIDVYNDFFCSCIDMHVKTLKWERECFPEKLWTEHSHSDPAGMKFVGMMQYWKATKQYPPRNGDELIDWDVEKYENATLQFHKRKRPNKIKTNE